MIVAVLRPARPYADLSDLTAKEIIGRGWQDVDGLEQYVVQYAVNLTDAEEAAVRRRRRVHRERARRLPRPPRRRPAGDVGTSLAAT
jgi:hypothetical protein